MDFVTKIDLNDPIIPGQGVGEIKLLENAFSLREYILSNTLSGTDNYWTFTTNNQFPDWLNLNYKKILTIGVNIYTGKIISITVRKGYGGRVFNTIQVGSLVSELFKIDAGFYYDEMDEYIYHKDNTDIYFDIDLKNKVTPTDEEILNCCIIEITIQNDVQATTTIDVKEFPKEWIEK